MNSYLLKPLVSLLPIFVCILIIWYLRKRTDNLNRTIHLGEIR